MLCTLAGTLALAGTLGACCSRVLLAGTLGVLLAGAARGHAVRAERARKTAKNVREKFFEAVFNAYFSRPPRYVLPPLPCCSSIDAECSSRYWSSSPKRNVRCAEAGAHSS